MASEREAPQTLGEIAEAALAEARLLEKALASGAIQPLSDALLDWSLDAPAQAAETSDTPHSRVLLVMLGKGLGIPPGSPAVGDDHIGSRGAD